MWMVDQFIWGRVTRISPEAPVPVVEFERENFMPGGAANVARNLTALGSKAEMFSVIGRDSAADQLRDLLNENQVDCRRACLPSDDRMTTKKRPNHRPSTADCAAWISRAVWAISPAKKATLHLLAALDQHLEGADAVIVGDYGKGVVTQLLIDEIKLRCRPRGIWMSLDPKPVHHLNLTGFSLVTPNRKEAFELAGIPDDTRHQS